MTMPQANRKKDRLPTLETGAAQLLMEIADAEVSMDRIVQLVEVSPSIAARLLAMANSAWSNPVAPVTSVADACSRLGLNVVRTTTIALAIGQSFDTGRCPAFDVDRFWCTSIIASRLIADLAPRFGVEPNTAATAALLHNIGLLWLADTMPGETHESLVDANDQAELGISAFLQQRCGTNRVQASQTLYAAWRLPDALTGRSDDEGKLATLITRCEEMATEIFAEVEPDAAATVAGDAAIAPIYEKHLAELPKTRTLAAMLF